VKLLRPFLFGLLFGFGLILSGMTDPARVIGFLDVTGRWDPTLAFVMGGAVLTALPFFALARKRGRALSGATLDQPASGKPDRALLIGSAIFGVGWGLTGICPGPALVSFGLSPWPTIAFLVPMTAGLLLTGPILARLKRPSGA